MDVLDRLFRRLVQNIRAGHPHYLNEPFGVAELFQTLVPYRHNRAELGIEMNQDYELALMRLLAGERDYLRGDQAMQSALSEALLSAHPDTTRYRDFAEARVRLNPDAAGRVEPAAPARAAQPAADRTVVMNAGRAEPPPPVARPALERTGVMPTQGSGAAGLEPPPPPPRPAPEPERAGAEAAFPDPSAFGFPMRAPAPGPAARPSGASPVAPAAQTPPGSAPGILAQGSCRYCGGTLPDGRRITYCPHCGQNLTVRQCPACSTELELSWRFCVTCGRQAT